MTVDDRGVPAGHPRRRRIAARHAVGARPAAGRCRTAMGHLPAGPVAAGRHRRGADRRGGRRAGGGRRRGAFRRRRPGGRRRARPAAVRHRSAGAAARSDCAAGRSRRRRPAAWSTVPEDVLERMREQSDKDRRGNADPLRRGRARRAWRDARRHRAATAAGSRVRADAAAVGHDTESALLQRVERIETRLDMSIPAGDQPGAPKQYSRRSKAEPRLPKRLPSPRPHRR